MTRTALAVFLLLVTSGLVVGAAALAGAQPAPPRLLSFLDVLKGSDEVQLRWPVAVAASSAEEVVVADAFASRLLRFLKVGVSWQLDKEVSIGGVPAGLAWDGRRYVASLREGKGLVAFEGPELAQRPLALPRGVVPGPLAAYPNGDLLLYDYAGGRALRLARDGAAEAEFGIPGEVTALAVGTAGGFFAAVASQGLVHHFNAGGGREATWRLPPFEEVPAWPVGLAAEPGGHLLVVDRHTGRLLVLDAGGKVIGLGARKGWEPGLLLHPAGITRLPDGLVLVADEGNGRAQLFRRNE